jgi:hypothetical protein
MFIEHQVAKLRAHGWEVEVKQSEDYITAFASNGRLFNRTFIGLGAYRSSVTGRWNLSSTMVFTPSTVRKYKTYSSASNAIECYGSEYLAVAARSAVTA